MRRSSTFVKAFVLCLLVFTAFKIQAQTWPRYILMARNDTLVDSFKYKFDVYIYEDPATPVPLNLNNYQLSFKILNTSTIVNGGTVTGAYVVGSSQLTDGTNTFYPGGSFGIGMGIYTSGGYKLPQVKATNPNSNYLHIPQTGLRVGTFIISNTKPFGQNTMNMTWWNYSPATSLLYVLLGSPPSAPNTLISPLPDSIPPYHIIDFTNPILNRPINIYNMTGGGFYCVGGPGVNVGLDGSEVGVVYQLWNGTSPVGGPVMGTGAPLSFGLQPAGNYFCIAYRDATYITDTMNGQSLVSVGNPQPPIYGDSTLCPGSLSQFYATDGGKTNYVWTVVGGTIVSGGGTSDSSVVVNWGSSPPASVSVNYIDAGCTLPSNTTTVNVTFNSTSSTAPSGITATNNPICGGSPTTLNVNGGSLGTGAVWTWYTGSCGGTLTGTGSSILVSPLSTTTYFVRAEGDCNITTCASLTINVSSSLPATVSISANPSGAVCAGATVNFTATPGNGGSTPVYAWYVGSTPVGTNSPNFSSSTLVNGDVVSCVMTSSEPCATGSPATSNSITMSITPNQPVSVSIYPSPSGPICSGDLVTFTALPSNGGTTPSYVWMVNNIPVGTNSSTYATNTLSNGDVVKCVMTSNLTPCVSGNPATSNLITMTVYSSLQVSVSVSANPAGPICVGTGVTFTAFAVNGGSNPVYAWYLNGVVVGGNSATYNNPGLADGDSIVCKLTSNAAPCAVGNPALSTPIIMDVNPLIPVSVSIAANPPGAICEGTNVTYTATAQNPGGSPVYVWYLNGTPVGTNSPTYSSTSFDDGDWIYCVLNSSATPCAVGNPAISDTIDMTVIPSLPVSVTISANPTGSICVGTNVTFTAAPVNGGTSPVYQWYCNGNPVGTGGNTWSSSSLTDGDIISCQLTSNAAPCATGNPAWSNTITMSVLPLLPVSVSITASSTNICVGSPVDFLAHPVYGGGTPTYEWYLNGSLVGTNNPGYSNSSLNNGDEVYCIMTSSMQCTQSNPVYSDTLVITVVTTLVADVTISTTNTAICHGSPAQFTASPVNGGTTPVYQWQVNGMNAGASGPVFLTSSLVNGDVVSCIMTSSESCATNNPATSNGISMTVHPLPVVHLGNDTTICENFQLTLDAGPGFSSYLWSDSSTAQQLTFLGSDLGIGTTQIIVTVTNTFTCKASDSVRITVSPCTGIEEPVNTLLMSCYPNPVNGILNVRFEGLTGYDAELMLFNMQGAMIYNERITGSGSALRQLDVSGYPAGMYFLRAYIGDVMLTKKVIVE